MGTLLEKKCNVKRPIAGQPAAVVALTATVSKNLESDSREVSVTVLPWTNAEALSLDINKITYESILGSNASETLVRTDLTLPASGSMGSTITWSSSNEAVISSDDLTLGKVTRPAFSTGDITVTMTATVSVGTESQKKTFVIKVIKLDQTIPEELESYVNSVSINNLLDTNTDFENITADLYFPLVGPNGISNSWASSDPLIISNNGTVYPPSLSTGSQTVTVTLTASKNALTKTRTYTFRVLAQ